MTLRPVARAVKARGRIEPVPDWRCLERPRFNMSTSIKGNATMTEVITPQYILRSVFVALGQGLISLAVEQFDDHFTFNDRALGLTFSDKGRLSDYFKKSRELLPDTAVEVKSAFECADFAFAEWKLTAIHSTSYGSVQVRTPIVLPGASIARIESGRIRYWSDYYDEKASMRLTLASFFVEWIEY